MMLQRNPNLLALTPMQLSSHHTGASSPQEIFTARAVPFARAKQKTATNRCKHLSTIAFAAMHKHRTAQPMKLQAKCSTPVQSAVGKSPLRRQSKLHLKTWKKVSKVDSSPCTSNCSNTCAAQQQKHNMISSEANKDTGTLHSKPAQ